MVIATLTCHPASPCPHITEFTAQLSLMPDNRVLLRAKLDGAVDQLRIPAPTPPRRRDGLWQHTCFEVFLRSDPSGPYSEFNFSPSGEWAAYRFEDYRHSMSDAALDTPRIECLKAPGHLHLEAEFILPVPLQKRALSVSLTAVLEGHDGQVSYWAARHASHEPDFHHRDSFVLQLPRAAL